MSKVKLPTKFTKIKQPDQLTVVEVGRGGAMPLGQICFYFILFYVMDGDFAHIIYLTLLCFKDFFLRI